MPKKRSSKPRNPQAWFVLGLFGTLLAAPNATVIRYAVEHTDPFLFNILRFATIAALTLPFLLVSFFAIPKRSWKPALLGGFYMAVAVASYVLAIKNSQASYVATITLITPIIFILYSARMTGEKITNRAVAGITLAAIGAMTIVALPIAIHQQGQFVFYSAATFWALVNCLSFPLAMIYMRRANEAGMKMMPMMSVTYLVVVAVNVLCFVGFGSNATKIDSHAVTGIVYSSLVVALVARAISVIVYERIGSAITGALAYLETLLAILIPVFALHEQLSTEMVVGGILILLGVYVVEHHKSKSHRHYHLFRLH